MSVFGYGQSYYARGPGQGLQENPQMSQSFSGTPSAPTQNAFDPSNIQQQQGVQFNPVATTPWGNYEYAPGPKNRSTAEWGRAQWRNPIEEIFGGQNSLSGIPGKYDQPASSPTMQGSGRLAQESIQPWQPGYSPKSFDQLMSQIQNLTPDQLIQIDTAGKYQGMFNKAAQEYSNAFANPYYASSFGGASRLNPIPGQGLDTAGRWVDPANRAKYNIAHGANAQWTGENVQNSLMSAYSDLVKRLGDSGLL